MALLRLSSPLRFNVNISAVCLKIDGTRGAAAYITDDLDGVVVGWGNDGRLERVPMKTMSYHQCTNRVLAGGRLVDDKFCIENKYGVTVCRGDSGGGYVTYDNYSKSYTLRGVVSYAPYQTDNCADHGIVMVTNINYMHPNLQNILEDYQHQDRKLF